MNKWVKNIGIILFIISFFILMFGAFINMILFWIGFIIIMVESLALLLWQIKRLDWKCDKCGTVFTINWKQSLLGVNGGSVKELYCPHCQKKTWCSPVLKQR